MMKIIADSSANITALAGVSYQSVPMTIRAGERDFVDDETLDPHELLDYLASYSGKSGTACPSLDCWLRAFEGADEIFVLTITSRLSGTCASAMAARDVYLQSHPDTKIHVFDTLSTGPEMQLLAERIAALYAMGLSFDVICEKAREYLATTHLFFRLKSLHNLAQNGRVSKLTAGAVGILGIQILSTASSEGTIQPVEKCRGEKKTREAMVQHILDAGYRGGKVRIHHAENPDAAGALAASLRERFPEADIEILPCAGLCSYYAERGGVIVGFETI
jgi:DegV family protein with EDD domain